MRISLPFEREEGDFPPLQGEGQGGGGSGYFVL